MRSHSVKEAGSILGPAVLIILFPALFTQVINLDGIESFWFAIPVVNVLLALRELLMNRVVRARCHLARVFNDLCIGRRILCRSPVQA